MGKPAKPIQLMVGLLILKQVCNLSDEDVAMQWAENAFDDENGNALGTRVELFIHVF